MNNSVKQLHPLTELCVFKWPSSVFVREGSSFSTEKSAPYQKGIQDRSFRMSYRYGRKSLRDAYEEHFSPMDTREAKVQRVLNIVEKRSPMPLLRLEYERDFHDDQWYGGSRNYQDARECHGEGSYPPYDRRYFDENPNFGNFRRNSSPPRNEGPYSQQCYGRDDLRHQLDSRNNGRPGPYFRNRGRGFGPPRRPVQDGKAKEDHDNYRISPPVVIMRDRSPGRREAQPSVRGRSASNSSNRSFSPDRDKGCANQQAQLRHKPNVLMSHTPSNSVEGSPHNSGSSKEKTPTSVAESEEVVAASMEPKLTPEEDFKTHRLEAIRAKALEIEKHYRQDCETFRTVVKMLVSKEPSLDNLLQTPLDENLLEIKQRCLDALRHFVKELDEVLEQPDTSAQATGHKTLE
ncbi:periphilin-1-like isoform X2 [Xiphias gladius]|uniref:periphilin-1-like isoform X2 n=1 Tax=Xiphias gladius TaxID=8245 RepID=UPI001A98259A|nr:periphilin-1-like isoform X2 [Xiphias gladius]